jgi:hypothetical protein
LKSYATGGHDVFGGFYRTGKQGDLNMKRKALGVLVAFAATAPAVVAPQLVVSAQAQPAGAQNAEYPDVPRGHWAYEAINKLSQAGVLEGYPDGNYYGNKPMTRYEFAVAIARLMGRITVPTQPTGEGRIGPVGPQGPQGPAGAVGPAGPQLPDLVFKRDIANFITRAEVNDLIAALRKEFADELARLGVRVDNLEGRVQALENRKPVPPRHALSLGLLHRLGNNYAISNNGSGIAGGIPGRAVVNGNRPIGPGGFTPQIPGRSIPNRRERVGATKFGYTDFELRLTDRISDRLSATAALRSLGNTNEDPWAGDSEGGFYLREAYAVADLSDKNAFLIRNLSAVLGRQRTKVAQGLLYDNDLAPTDQVHAMGNIGPVKLMGFIGSNDGSSTLGVGDFYTDPQYPGINRANPYLDSGAVRWLGAGNGARAGFGARPLAGGRFTEGNESLVRVSANLFRLGGRPVELGATKLLAGVQNEEGYGFDLSLPILGRNIGFEWVTKQRHMQGTGAGTGVGAGDNAYVVTIPVLRTGFLDLNAAYGAAGAGFSYFAASSANPYARTWGEAIFDRPLALGAPMINGAGGVGDLQSLAAKRTFDVNGSVRVPVSFLRRTPIDFRWYNASAPGVDLGSVWSVGSTFNLTPGVDLELKYGRYQVAGPTPSIPYWRLGANVGF